MHRVRLQSSAQQCRWWQLQLERFTVGCRILSRVQLQQRTYRLSPSRGVGCGQWLWFVQYLLRGSGTRFTCGRYHCSEGRVYHSQGCWSEERLDTALWRVRDHVQLVLLRTHPSSGRCSLWHRELHRQQLHADRPLDHLGQARQHADRR